jgi:hypothetical protein
MILQIFTFNDHYEKNTCPFLPLQSKHKYLDQIERIQMSGVSEKSKSKLKLI